MKYIINDQMSLMRPPEGPVAAFVRPFSEWVREQGYTLVSLRQRVRIAAGFSRWLGKKGIRPPNIRSEHCAQYLRTRRLRVHPGDATALNQFLEFLRCQGVTAAERVARRRLTPVERCAQDFERYLREERVLAEATIVNYVPFVSAFLEERFGSGPIKLSSLRAGDVVGFVQRQASRLHLKRAKLLTTALRSFFQYARYRGEIRLDLATVVPCVANWSMPSIPRGIAPDQVRRPPRVSMT